MKRRQAVVFILDDPGAAEKGSLWNAVRQCVHSLRGYAFSKDRELSVAFATLSSGPEHDAAENLSFCDFDTFSVEEGRQYFAAAGFSALNYYFSTQAEDGAALPPLVVVLHTDLLDRQQNWRRLCSLVHFSSARKITASQGEWQELPARLFSARGLPLPEAPSLGRSRGLFRRAAGTGARKVLAGIGIAAACAVLLMLLVPRFLPSSGGIRLHPASALYKKVHTGDGDRLILRTQGDPAAPEIMRLNEDETVQVLEEGSVFSKVRYHAFEGYVRNGADEGKVWLLAATAQDYEITAPDSLYQYGRACLQQGVEETDGYSWIEKAADLDELSAQWEMFRFYENGSQGIQHSPLQKAAVDAPQARAYLERIDGNGHSAEEQEAEHCRAIAKNLETTAQKALVQKYLAKAAEKERTVAAIRRQAEKKLSELAFATDVEAASGYYKKALSFGLEGDPDYMYALAVGTDLNEADSLDWLRKASALGHYKSSRVLANYYFNNANYDAALTYFQAASRQSDGAAPAYYCGWIYYHQKSNYARAVEYFRTAVNAYDGSTEFYQANYYLGWCYEYGQGVSANNREALGYYSMARGTVEQADEAYTRVYRKIYGGYNYYDWD